MNVCDECGRIKVEETYDMTFKPIEIPDIIMQEAKELIKKEEAAGLYIGFGCSQHRLLRNALKRVILSKL